MPISSYRELIVWEKSIELVEVIYFITKCFPGDERFGLTSQLRRAAVSVPSNIAEGHTRKSSRDYLRHISISLGSLAEIDTQVEIARRLNYLENDDFTRIKSNTVEIGKMLRAIQNRIEDKIK